MAIRIRTIGQAKWEQATGSGYAPRMRMPRVPAARGFRPPVRGEAASVLDHPTADVDNVPDIHQDVPESCTRVTR
jgi:hypothetical protein